MGLEFVSNYELMMDLEFVSNYEFMMDLVVFNIDKEIIHVSTRIQWPVSTVIFWYNFGICAFTVAVMREYRTHICIWEDQRHGGGRWRNEIYYLTGYVIQLFYVGAKILIIVRMLNLWLELQGLCGAKMNQLPFMGVVCTVMLYVIYRTTNYQYQQTEVCVLTQFFFLL